MLMPVGDRGEGTSAGQHRRGGAMRDRFSRPDPASSTQAAAMSLPPGDGPGGSDDRVWRLWA
jgi:hypothetical protein